jgi:hypothetical protein
MPDAPVLPGPMDLGRTFYSPLPLDFLILEKLPDEGTIGGIHWRGRRIVDLREEINEDLRGEATVNSSELMARLRSMHGGAEHGPGLVKPYQGRRNGAKIWARTQRGAEFLRHKEAYLGNHAA